MSARERIHEAILASIDATKLPESHTGPLRDAVTNLFESRPNAMNKIQAPLGRALRNPTFPGIWTRCVADIPDTEIYAGLRDAANAIAGLVDAPKG